MNEKVERILNSVSIKMYPSREDAERAIKKRNKKLSKEICHLFPKSPDNPDGFEAGLEFPPDGSPPAPKPDDRLLTKDEWLAIWYSGDDEKHLKVYKDYLSGLIRQDAKTASIKDKECQDRVREIYDRLKSLYDAEWMVTHDWGGDREAILKSVRKVLRKYKQDLKQKEGVENG